MFVHVYRRHFPRLQYLHNARLTYLFQRTMPFNKSHLVTFSTRFRIHNGFRIHLYATTVIHWTLFSTLQNSDLP